MAEVTKTSFEQVQEALKQLPGNIGDVKKAALELLGKTELPTDDAGKKTLEEASAALLKENATLFEKIGRFGKQVGVERDYAAAELNAYGLADADARTKALNELAEKTKELTKTNKLVHGEESADVAAEVGAFFNKKAGDTKDSVLKNYATKVLNTQETHALLTADILDRVKTFASATGLDAEAIKAKFAERLQGKSSAEIGELYKEFGTQFEALSTAKATELEGVANLVKRNLGENTDKHKEALANLANYKDNIAGVKEKFESGFKGVLNGVTGKIQVTEHADYAGKLAKEVSGIVENGKLTDAHVLDQATQGLDLDKGNIVIEQSKENLNTITKNIGSKFKEIAKNVTQAVTAPAAMSKLKAGGIVAAATAGTLLLANSLSKTTVKDDQGNVVTDENGKAEKRTNGLTFLAVTAVGVGAMVLLGKKTEIGKQVVEGAKQIFGKHTAKVVADSGARGIGGIQL